MKLKKVICVICAIVLVLNFGQFMIKKINIVFDENLSGQFVGDFNVKVKTIGYRGWCVINENEEPFCDFEKGQTYSFTLEIVPTFSLFFFRNAEDFDITINGYKPTNVYFAHPAYVSTFLGRILKYPKVLCVEFSFTCS